MSNEYHGQVAKYIQEHPLFQEVLTANLMVDVEKNRWPRGPVGAPELYICILDALLGHPRVDLGFLEAGLRLVFDQAPKQPRTDLISNLQSNGPVGGVFELACFGAIVTSFGSEAIEPYPRLPDGRHMDARLSYCGQDVFFEFSVLDFARHVKTQREYALQHGGKHYAASLPGLGEGRLIQKVEEKLCRACTGHPNVLLLSQYGNLPFPEKAVTLISDYLQEYGCAEPAVYCSAILYLDRFKLQRDLINPHAREANVLPSPIVDCMCKCFKTMCAPLE